MLDERLTTQLMPLLEVREASARAAAVVDELDAEIGRIESERKWQRGRLLINPGLWIDGFAQLGVTLGGIASGAPAEFARYSATDILQRIAAAVVLIVLGPLLVGTAARRRVIKRLQQRFLRSKTKAGRLVTALVEDLLAALLILVATLFAFTAIGLIISLFLDVASVFNAIAIVVFAAVIVALGSWLGHSALRSPFPDLRLVQLTSEQARRGVRIVRNLSIVLALAAILASADQLGLVERDIYWLFETLFVFLGSWLVWNLANVIRSSRAHLETVANLEARQSEAASVAPHDQPMDLSGAIAKILKILVVATVVAAVLGYVTLALDVFAASVASIAILAVAVFMHRSLRLVFELLADNTFRTYRKVLRLLPIFTGFLIAVATLPLFAIVWGYRAQEIGDAIVALQTVVEFGDITLSIGDAFKFGIVFVAGFLITKWLQRFVRTAVLPQTGVDVGASAAIVTGIGYIGIMLAAVIAIASTGLDLTSLAFVFGALSVGIGFGLQKVVENFTSGVLLLIERPIREGDWIEVGSHSGVVRKVAVRSTHIETWDRHWIIVPNSEFITGSVKNYSFAQGAARIIVPVGVAYDSDLEAVRDAMLEVAAEHENVLTEPAPAVAMDDFGDSSITVKLLCFVEEVTTGAPTASDLRFAIAAKFAERGIVIPFPRRDVHIVDDSEKTGSRDNA
ncbi:mechanosensitive ion channel family protein [Aurantiacibacter hainanensis]|uniref:mechanosensitive ion channel family protein n=1 Tax=Aurantiacibacter hainanensis TaxID=3076114 RepID=UPI0030C67615